MRSELDTCSRLIQIRSEIALYGKIVDKKRTYTQLGTKYKVKMCIYETGITCHETSQKKARPYARNTL